MPPPSQVWHASPNLKDSGNYWRVATRPIAACYQLVDIPCLSDCRHNLWVILAIM